jgi:hypothetical protein
VQGAQAFQILAQHLKETGEGGLRRDLNKAIRDAAKPAADLVGNTSHLKEYMPNRYAGVLARDLEVTTSARAGGTSPGITIRARAPTVGGSGRRVKRLDAGVLGHPVFGRRSKTNPRRWANWVYQEDGMAPRFFEDQLERAAPQVPDGILQAMRDNTDKITKRT